MPRPPDEQLYFIDFEASSLSGDSWPIEIGLAWIDEREKLRSTSKLIKPPLQWPAADWSKASERIHGIRREELETAEEAKDVARWLAKQLIGKRILSDAAEFDGRWMQRLMATFSRDRIYEISSIQLEACSRFEGDAMAMFFRAFARNRTKHRAASDALNLAQAWRAALRLEHKTKGRS